MSVTIDLKMLGFALVIIAVVILIIYLVLLVRKLIVTMTKVNTLLDDVQLHRQINQFDPLRDALAIHDVEIRFFERRRNLVLHNLCTRPVTNDLAAVLDGLSAADVDADRGVKFQRVTAGRRLGVAVHDADLHTKLVDENDNAVRL